MDFWISDWISGFQTGFLDFMVDFWTSSLDFWISWWSFGFQFGFLPTVYKNSFITDPSFQSAILDYATAVVVE